MKVKAVIALLFGVVPERTKPYVSPHVCLPRFYQQLDPYGTSKSVAFSPRTTVAQQCNTRVRNVFRTSTGISAKE